MVKAVNILKEKKKLLDSMGENQDRYWALLRSWFKMELSRDELERELGKFLIPSQLILHNQFLLNLARKPIGLVQPPSPPGKFEPIHPANYVVTERLDIEVEMPLGMASRGYLFDLPSMMARVKYGALEMGLKGSSSNAAHLLLLAMQHFLKNIVTAVVMRRKGFRCRTNGYVHSLGVPAVTMASRNGRKKLEAEPFQSLIIDDKVEELLIPNCRKPLEEIERERAFNISCNNELAPVSLYDLILTLKLYPNLVASNFVNTVNVERIYARLRHPYYDA